MYSDPTFITQRLSYAVSVIGFGADPTGMTDSGAAFAAAIEACRERNYSTLHVPAGTYIITSFTTEGSACDPAEKVGWCLSNLNGLCIRGDGAFRSGTANQTGTTIEFRFPVAGGVGIGIKGCTALRFENLTINGAEPTTPTVANPAIGVRIQPSGGEEPVRSRGIQFQNCSFRWCEIVVQTTASLGNSDLSFYDCAFGPAGIGFQSFDNSAVAHQFIGCTGGGSAAPDGFSFQGMETMFDLQGGGKITVVGFGGGPVKTLLRVGAGNGSIGWNVLQNVRLEQFGGKTEPAPTNTWGIDNRTQFYDADVPSDGASGQRTLFDGIIVTPPGIDPPGSDVPADDGTPRFALLDGHTVILRNAGRHVPSVQRLGSAGRPPRS